MNYDFPEMMVCIARDDDTKPIITCTSLDSLVPEPWRMTKLGLRCFNSLHSTKHYPACASLAPHQLKAHTHGLAPKNVVKFWGENPNVGYSEHILRDEALESK
ncbi:hypothetical protein N7453_006979 [Penicillium expansum]|nr:hypothetical protein N7453_006979 [Penicillium expansum]